MQSIPAARSLAVAFSGDKTRMNDLARAEAAFIRPVPSSGHLGGASQRARELMLLCEAAGL